MNLRQYDPHEDYAQVKRWWIGHGQQPEQVCPPDILPTDGFIIDDVCCAWVYLSANAKMSRLAWPVSNPIATPKRVYSGLSEVILTLHEFAAECGCPFMEATFSDPSLGRLAKTLGFQTGDTNITGYFRGI